MTKSVLSIPNTAVIGLLYFSTLIYSFVKRFVPLIRSIQQVLLGDFFPWVYEPYEIKPLTSQDFTFEETVKVCFVLLIA
jgi:hypothetical protein